jgi:Polyketide cyclase / dehydrase and lipid transport
MLRPAMVIALVILAVLAALVGALLLVASRRPDAVHYVRARTLPAAPEAIMPHLVDFRRWAAWSPWERLDPAMKREHGGATSGVGATHHWLGNKKVGEGRMTILAVTASEVKVKLEFIRPFAATNDTAFTLAAASTGTAVTWTMDGHATLMMKVFGLLMNMDAMIGKDFERGLAALEDAVASARP